jgi:hypothetical protein
MEDSRTVEVKRVRFLFWPVQPSISKPLPAEARRTGQLVTAGECSTDIVQAMPETEWEAINEVLCQHAPSFLKTYRTQFLRAALRTAGATKFIPHRPPSWDYNRAEQTLEVCFYHNREMHDVVYATDPFFVMQPTEELQSRLEKLYEAHGTNDTDDDFYAHAHAHTETGQ